MNNDKNNEVEQLSSLAAEQSVLGIIIQDGTRFPDVCEKIGSNDFYFKNNREIFLACESLAKDNSEIDIITICEKIFSMSGNDYLEYLTDLTETSISGANVMAYVSIVSDKAVKRSVVNAISSSYSDILANPKLTGSEAVEMAQKAVISLSDKQTEALDVSHVDDALKLLIKNMEKRWKDGDVLDGLSSGLEAMDKKVLGWKPGNLIIIAGRPGMGKTTYALQLACDMWTRQGKNGLFFSCEMSTQELMEKAMACVGHIPLALIKKPTDHFFENYSSALQVGASKLKDKSAYIVDCPGIHINQLKSYARKAHKRKPLDFIMADHINIMTGDGNSPNHVVGSITGGLKQIAKELGIPVFGLAQLNRGVESRTNKRPLISDLRESGSMEQDADIIQLLYREDYYKEEGEGTKPNDGLLEINTAKFRNGERGTTYYDHKLDQSRIEDTPRTAIFEELPMKKSRGF